MFRVVITKYVWDQDDVEASKMRVLLGRELELPFAPFVDLELTDGAWMSGAIKTVQWDVPAQRFTCAVADEFPYSRGVDDYTFDWLVRDATDNGWSELARHNDSCL